MNAFRYNGKTYCYEHLPVGVSYLDSDVNPIRKWETVQTFPSCASCGKLHDYMVLEVTTPADNEVNEEDRPKVTIFDIAGLAILGNLAYQTVQAAKAVSDSLKSASPPPPQARTLRPEVAYDVQATLKAVYDTIARMEREAEALKNGG